MYKKLCKPFVSMAFLSLLVKGFLGFLAVNGVFCVDNGGGDMEEDELFGLFDVMGSLLDDPNWAQMYPLPCTETPWPGVECELLEETLIFHVTKIHIGEDILIPPCKKSAKISESLLKLPYLKTLSLISCFTESQIVLTKQIFGSLPFLEHLALESNPTLSGEIPSSISNLANLNTLRLSQNNLIGEIPKEIGGLVNLQQLDLSHNSLSGLIPEEIGSLEKLEILDISWNLLQETVPSSISQLQLLEKIDLSSNKLQGKVPPELGKLQRLVLLDLSHNSLSGPIPENLSNLQKLEYLMMEDNPLNARIPSFLGSLTKLSVLILSGCGLTGPIPTTFSRLTNLTALSLDNNTLHGTVPQELGTLPRLDTLNLSRNQLIGELLFPQDFMNRLGQRLDIRENKGLCTNQEEHVGNTSSRFLQNPTCSTAMLNSSRNKTLAGQNPDRGKNMDPKLYNGSITLKGYDMGKEFVVFLGLIFLFLSFGL